MTEHMMKIQERIMDGRLGKIINIHNMQFGLRRGRATADAMSILRTATGEKP